MRDSLGRAQHACIQMLRRLFIPDIKGCVGFIRTIFRNDDVVILSGYDALYVVTRGLA